MNDVYVLVQISLFPGMFWAIYLHHGIGSRSSFLCENGVLYNSKFIPWNDVLRDEWHNEEN